MSTPSNVSNALNIPQARFNMIEQQIRPWDVHDPVVLELLDRVKREDFVPEEHRALAFVDMALPLPEGQAMLQPKVVARLMQELQVKPHERVLEIGAGSGYLTAMLASCAKQVVSLEISPTLVALTQANLKRAGFTNVEVRQADGAKDQSALGAFDVIVLSGSVASVPPELLGQLKVGGRLAAIVGEEPVMRATFVTHTGDKQFATRQPWDIHAPRLLNFAETSGFQF
jgi:protein-L-isoaspartate(D-aspartate) O-methyltransferase